jgi:F-type H+-transporting ATPase subunit b
MLDISPLLLVVTGIIFLLLLLKLNSSLFRPILRYIDDREESIKRDLHRADEIGSRVDDMLQEANSIISKAKVEANAIRQSSTEKTSSTIEEKVTSQSQKLESSYNAFLVSLEHEKKDLREQLGSSKNEFKELIKSKLKVA